jgi:eukaryotic-like serine/threonine-protein kinase
LHVLELAMSSNPDQGAPIKIGPGTGPKFILQGRYQVERKLGAGGMSMVYLARDLRFGSIERWCAVKEMTNTGADSQTRRLNLDNFQREANILASLSHPAIPKVYDFFSQDSKSFLVLEYVDGVDLEGIWSRAHKALPTKDVVNWALQICHVLSYLHERQPPIVFRDVKPSNIMLTNQQQRIMLIDFGIAKLFQSGPKGTMIGTEGYAPPEQYRGVAEPRGDLYALGATMHHLLTNKDPRLEAPFTFHERPIHELNPEVTPLLEEAINKALQYDAEQRFANAREMTIALTRAVSGGNTSSFGSAHLEAAPTISTPRAEASAPTTAGQVKPIWKFKCEDEVRSSPRILGSILHVGCYDHNLYAVDIQTGKFAWKYPTDGGISSTPLVTPDKIYVGSEDGNLYALSHQRGQVLWRAHTRGPIRSSPRLAGNLVIVGSDDGGIFAFRVEDGLQAWRFPALQSVRSSAIIVNEVVIIGSDDGNVYGLQLRDGRQRWRYNAGRFVISTPAYEDGLAILGSGDMAVHGIDARSGWAIWRTRTGGPVVSSPVIENGVAYIGSADGNLYALNVKSGRVHWKANVGSQIASSPCVANGVVYFGSEDGNVNALDARNGSLRWSFKTGGMITSSPLVHEDRLYVGSTDHFIYALPIN